MHAHLLPAGFQDGQGQEKGVHGGGQVEAAVANDGVAAEPGAVLLLEPVHLLQVAVQAQVLRGNPCISGSTCVATSHIHIGVVFIDLCKA